MPTKLGFMMALDKADFVQRTIFYEGEYEPEVWCLLTQHLLHTDVFYDVGANVGYFCCGALTRGVRSVCAFEPDPLTSSVLRLNLGLNGLLDDRCHLYEMALGSRTGAKTFYRSHVSNTGTSGFTPRNSVASFEVELRTLDSVAFESEETRPSVIKIDVEGVEFDVLTGARKLLEVAPPRLIVFEAPKDLLINSSQHRLVSLLRRYDYFIEHIPRQSGVVEEVENYAAFRRL